MKTFKQHLNEAHCEMTKMVTDYVKDKKEPTFDGNDKDKEILMAGLIHTGYKDIRRCVQKLKRNGYRVNRGIVRKALSKVKSVIKRKPPRKIGGRFQKT